jgi:hypothetical protein
LDLPEGSNLGKAVNEAMRMIEEHNPAHGAKARELEDGVDKVLQQLLSGDRNSRVRVILRL